MSIYNYLSYKKAIKEELYSKKIRYPDLTFEKMAIHCRIQKTYLSKVLNREGDLNQDQLYMACEYLKLKKSEQEFVFLLHSHNTSIHASRKKEILIEIENIQKQQMKSEAHIEVKSNSINFVDYQKYYLDPYLQVIHMFLTIPKFQNDISLITEFLTELNKKTIEEKIKQLEEMQLIAWKNNKWEAIESNLHLKSDAPIYKAYRKLLRMKSIEKLDHSDQEENYSFSVIFSSNAKVRAEIQKRFLEFLKEIQKMVQNEKETDVYQLNFDLFAWS
jgi:uncharacterized protein (TIGR02147 family)